MAFEPNFTDPGWLDSVVARFPQLGHKDVLRRIRASEEMENQPWMFFLERQVKLLGIDPSMLVNIICDRYPPLSPVLLDSIAPADYASVFPQRLIDRHYVVPFNAQGPFLSLAVLEPDRLNDFHQEYIIWAKEQTISLLQFFLTTPSSFTTYTEKLSHV